MKFTVWNSESHLTHRKKQMLIHDARTNNKERKLMEMNILIPAITLMALVICLYESLTVCKKIPINVAVKDLL